VDIACISTIGRIEKREELQKFPVLSRKTANCAVETSSPETASTAKPNALPNFGHHRRFCGGIS
jgi:hypothetical protein